MALLLCFILRWVFLVAHSPLFLSVRFSWIRQIQVLGAQLPSPQLAISCPSGPDTPLIISSIIVTETVASLAGGAPAGSSNSALEAGLRTLRSH